jgi:hypothetical protein
VVRRTDVTDPENQEHYFLHASLTYPKAGLECYYCLVNQSGYNPNDSETIKRISDTIKRIYDIPYYEAIARERYVQSSTRILDE